jgi:hypothetical protein
MKDSEQNYITIIHLFKCISLSTPVAHSLTVYHKLSTKSNNIFALYILSGEHLEHILLHSVAVLTPENKNGVLRPAFIGVLVRCPSAIVLTPHPSPTTKELTIILS